MCRQFDEHLRNTNKRIARPNPKPINTCITKIRYTSSRKTHKTACTEAKEDDKYKECHSRSLTKRKPDNEHCSNGECCHEKEGIEVPTEVREIGWNKPAKDWSSILIIPLAMKFEIRMHLMTWQSCNLRIHSSDEVECGRRAKASLNRICREQP